MRVILDFQACQSGSRFRGIGRGSRSLMLAMGRELIKRNHEVVCIFNEAFPEGLDFLKTDIQSNLREARVASFHIPLKSAAAWPQNAWRQAASCMLREVAIICHEPDYVHIPSLLSDGWSDDAVASIGLLDVHVPVSVTQHDLIPLVMSDRYMLQESYKNYYMAKVNNLKQAELLLAISEYTKREAIEYLDILPEKVVHISSAADGEFWKPLEGFQVSEILSKCPNLRPNFFLYAPGGFDYRKNLDSLIKAYSLLPNDIRSTHQLVIASRLDPESRKIIENSISINGLKATEVILTDYISDVTLRYLYCSCFAYVFPSLHEGFGLPALEAMSCGAPVIASNCTGIAEVVGMEDALFDPHDIESIANKLFRLHVDSDFYESLLEHSKNQPKKFSWERSALIAIDALEKSHKKMISEGWQRPSRLAIPDCTTMIEKLNMLVPDIKPTDSDLESFYFSYENNVRSYL